MPHASPGRLQDKNSDRRRCAHTHANVQQTSPSTADDRMRSGFAYQRRTRSTGATHTSSDQHHQHARTHTNAHTNTGQTSGGDRVIETRRTGRQIVECVYNWRISCRRCRRRRCRRPYGIGDDFRNRSETTVHGGIADNSCRRVGRNNHRGSRPQPIRMS